LLSLLTLRPSLFSCTLCRFLSLLDFSFFQATFFLHLILWAYPSRTGAVCALASSPVVGTDGPLRPCAVRLIVAYLSPRLPAICPVFWHKNPPYTSVRELFPKFFSIPIFLCPAAGQPHRPPFAPFHDPNASILDFLPPGYTRMLPSLTPAPLRHAPSSPLLPRNV